VVVVKGKKLGLRLRKAYQLAQAVKRNREIAQHVWEGLVDGIVHFIPPK
jgi:hypothetical protein